MKLADAYERLQWGAPLSFERAALGGENDAPTFPRGIGTSVHMLIELYLDIHRSRTSQFGRPYFLVRCLSSGQGRELRDWLSRIHHRLDLDVDLDRVRFSPTSGGTERIRGEIWYSWAIFCDHSVKEEDTVGADRNVGPYGLIRRLEPDNSRIRPFWRAYDRDDRYIGALTDNGKSDLMDTATCPITLGGTRPTTYPAAFLGTDVSVRLRKAFAR